MKAQGVIDLEKQLKALRRDIEASSAEIVKIDALYKHPPTTTAEMLKMVNSLKAPSGVDPASIQQPLFFHALQFSQVSCNVYLHAWTRKINELQTEAARLEKAIDYAPLAIIVDTLTKPIQGRGDVDVARKAIADLEDKTLADKVKQHRPDLPNLIDDAKKRLTDYLVLKG